MTARKARTALIVDDAYFMRNLLRSILEMGGYAVVAEAEDGKDALDRYRACRPDVVLMDVLMPEKNGADAAKDIIAFDGAAKIVMCSVVGQESYVGAARGAGAKGAVTKPFKAEEVLEVVKKVLEDTSAVRKEGREGKLVKSIASGRMIAE